MNLNTVEPFNGTFWKHYKGSCYKILTKAINSDDNIVKVIYQDVETGQVWELPLNEWLKKIVLESGEEVERFSVVNKYFKCLEEHWDCL